MTKADWLEMTEDIFTERFGKTPLKRAGLGKLKETVRILERPSSGPGGRLIWSASGR